ncbi:hypothetical protein M9H77_09340 [Catharanthus roseus]|uniref:Uncharacterized protein n=1 Tax=Catharanthus roseus TaxID=4058 RepID=A0ACC0C0H3_CATRO|nr:hypothetical protein M9H77_09340 [Catharanthus roseus]
MRDGGSGSGEGHKWFYFLHRASVEGQADLTERFSKSRHLEELHMHQIRDKKGQLTFHIINEILRDSTEGRGGSCSMGALMPNDLQLMATISGGLSRGQLYGAGTETAYLRAESSRAAASYLLYTPMPLMMDIVRATMAAIPLTSSSMTAVAGTSNARVSSSTSPPPSIDASSTIIVDPSSPHMAQS